MDVGGCKSKLLQAGRYECDLEVISGGLSHHAGVLPLHAACTATIGDLVRVGRLRIVLEG